MKVVEFYIYICKFLRWCTQVIFCFSYNFFLSLHAGKWKYVAKKLGFAGISAGTEMKLLYRR